MCSLALKPGMASAVFFVLVMPVHALWLGFHSIQTKEPTGSISGRVTAGGSPARGVTILLSPAESGPPERPLAKSTTDQDGRFHLSGIPAGQHLLQAFAPAFLVPGNNISGRLGRVINISAGEAIEGEDIALIRGATITGRVTDSDGQPVILERVRLYAVSEQGRAIPIYLPTVFPASYSTDDRGIYRLFGVPAGRYLLAVGMDTGSPIGRMSSGNTYYPVTYHPGDTDQAKATVIEVFAGSEATGVDIVVGRSSKTFTASGRIVDADTGTPIVAMQYGTMSLNNEGRQVYSTSSSGSTSGARGEFRIDGLAPGEYAAYAVPGPESDMSSDTARFTVTDTDITGLEVKVRRGSTITGTVVIEGAEGHREAPRPSDVRVGVSSGSLNAAARTALLSITPDGSFSVSGLPRGVANFSVFTSPVNKSLTLVRVERDGVEQKNGIEVGVAEEITGVKVVLGYGTGVIRGQVQIEGVESPAGAMMFLSLRRLGAVQHQGRTPQPPDLRGRFAIDGLLPGEYELSLIFQPKPVAGGSLPGSKSVKQTVTVKDGAETQVNLVVDLNDKNQ